MDLNGSCSRGFHPYDLLSLLGIKPQPALGIHRTTLISRMKKLGIEPRQYAP